MAKENHSKTKHYLGGATATAATATVEGAGSGGGSPFPQMAPGGFEPAVAVGNATALIPAAAAPDETAAGTRAGNRTSRKLSRLRALPPAYLAAWILFVLLVLTAAFGTLLTPHGIGDSEKFQFRQETVGGQTVYIVPPVRPNGEFLLGTDHRGIDLLSLLLNGMKLTLGFAAVIALCRFLLGMPLGLWGGSSRFYLGPSANGER